MITKFSNEAFINDFLNTMLKDAGMTDLDPEVEAQMMDDLRSRLQERFFATVVKNLSEEQLNELIKLDSKKASESEIEQFIGKNISNPSEVFAQAMMNFRADYLGV